MMPGAAMTWHTPGPSYPSYWTLNLVGVEIAGKGSVFDAGESDSKDYRPAEVMVDSGTSLIMVPPDYAPDVSIFNAASDCSNVGDLPELTIYIHKAGGGKAKYTLTGAEYTVNRAGQCLTGIVAGQGQMILGDVFIRKYYAAFNFEKGGKAGEVGFSLANQARP